MWEVLLCYAGNFVVEHSKLNNIFERFFFFALKQSATLLNPDSKRFAIQIIYAAFHWVPLCVQTSFTYVKNLSWTNTSKKRSWSQDGNSSFCYTKTTIIIIEFFVTQNITVTVLEIFSSGIFRTFLKKKSSTSTDFTFKHFVENIYIERKFILPGMRTLDPLPDLGPGEFMATKIFVALVISVNFLIFRREEVLSRTLPGELVT